MKQKRIERRRGPDVLQRTFVWVSVIAWVLFLGSLIAYHYARPEIPYSNFVNPDGVVYRDYWREDYQRLFVYLLWSCCGITLAGVLLNYRRSRRRSDHYLVNLGLLGLISVSSLFAYYVNLFR
ncbi:MULTISPECIES: hypothetical protein [Aliagarivorans]|uniref:hypothetical protein n=1 Tax=Aliagarivorans TaxID=882379 RepID=UPI0004207E10|nr:MULTISPECIES: hypothetical protein [Aliagarivorans]